MHAPFLLKHELSNTGRHSDQGRNSESRPFQKRALRARPDWLKADGKDVTKKVSAHTSESPQQDYVTA